MSDRKELRWAILGTGVVANEMALAFANAGRTIFSVGNRTHSKALAFAEKYHVTKVYDDFHEMFSDPDVDIIYITTPHNTHISFMLEALEHGKHVLCEKAITLNSVELKRAKEAAEKNGVILAEAMTIYHMPLYGMLWEMVQSGHFGEVRMIPLNFGSYKEYDMQNRFFNKELAGGALLDIGVYALSCARSFMSSKPDKILSQVKYAESGADEQAGIVLTNRQGEMAVISIALHSKGPKRAVISCDKAYIEIMEYPRADQAVITYTETGEKETVSLGEQKHALQYEMQDMERAVLDGADTICFSYTMDVMDMMSEIRQEWGMYYDSEEIGHILDHAEG